VKATSAATSATGAAAGSKGKGTQQGKGDKESADRAGADGREGPIHVTFAGIPRNEPDIDRKPPAGGAAGPGSLIGADQPRRDDKRIGETRASTKGILRPDRELERIHERPVLSLVVGCRHKAPHMRRRKLAHC
jgi:hypothetical protein